MLKHSEQLYSPKNKNQPISKKFVRVEENAENKKTFDEIKRKDQKGHDTVLKSMRNAKVVEGENTGNFDNLYKKILRDIRETK